MLKYVFMGTPAIAATVLKTLCEKAYPPIHVITQPAREAGRGYKLTPSAVEQFAREEKLSVTPVENINAPESVAQLAALSPDLFLVVAFGQILKEPVLALPKYCALNVHASLLPKYRGAAPVQRAIHNGDPITGVTIQKMVKKLDAGDILLQKTLPIAPDDTSATLLEKLAVLGGDALVEALAIIEAGQAKFTPQNEALVSIAKKLEKAEARLNFEEPAAKLVNAVRAFQPWPVAELYLNGQKLRVFRAEVVAGRSSQKPGSIDSDRKTFVKVQAGDGQALSLLEVQMENRKRMSITEFLRGYGASLTQIEPGP